MTFVLQPLLAMLASLTHQELVRQFVLPQEENRILRSRLPKRIAAMQCERSRLLALGRDLGKLLRGLVSVVSYGNFLPLGQGVQSRSPHSQTASAACRASPGLPETFRELVMRLARENSWGCTRILGQLRKLSITHNSRQTVKAILKAQGIVPVLERSGGTWTEFIRTHSKTPWQRGILTKTIWTPKGLVNLSVLAFLHIGTSDCVSPQPLAVLTLPG